ncbi:MAG: YraN family protein [Clostridia bacterium]|nr:YraN family protein [Clostridia bacterium]
MIRNQAGVWGEIYAVRWLRDRGWRILTTNYTCRFGELDIVAAKDGVVSFIEVKARAQDAMLRPMEAVDAQKQQRLTQAARQFLRTCKIEAELRFDVCEVYLTDGAELARINYMENAF